MTVRVCVRQAILGQLVRRPCSVDERLSAELLSCARPEDGFSTIAAKTMCTADFYEGVCVYILCK